MLRCHDSPFFADSKLAVSSPLRLEVELPTTLFTSATIWKESNSVSGSNKTEIYFHRTHVLVLFLGPHVPDECFQDGDVIVAAPAATTDCDFRTPPDQSRHQT